MIRYTTQESNAFFVNIVLLKYMQIDPRKSGGNVIQKFGIIQSSGHLFMKGY